MKLKKLQNYLKKYLINLKSYCFLQVNLEMFFFFFAGKSEKSKQVSKAYLYSDWRGSQTSSSVSRTTKSISDARAAASCGLWT